MIDPPKIFNLSEAIYSLRPNAEFSMWGDDYETIEWLNDSIAKPTFEEVKAEQQRLQVEYDKLNYQRQRFNAYPSIEEQLDIMFHSGFDAWKATIQAVKDQYPK